MVEVELGLMWKIQGLDALEELLSKELFEQLEMTQVDPHIPQIKENQSVPMFEGSSGKLIKVLESSKCYRLRRDKLRELLSRGLDVRYGKELAKIEVCVHLPFCVICRADGFFS